MKTNWKTALAAVALISLSGAAAANDRVHFSLSIGVPAPMVAYAPPPVVYYPQTPIYQTYPAYPVSRVYSPAPSYGYYAPRPVRDYYGPSRGHGQRHRHRH